MFSFQTARWRKKRGLCTLVHDSGAPCGYGVSRRGMDLCDRCMGIAKCGHPLVDEHGHETGESCGWKSKDGPCPLHGLTEDGRAALVAAITADPDLDPEQAARRVRRAADKAVRELRRGDKRILTRSRRKRWAAEAWVLYARHRQRLVGLCGAKNVPPWSTLRRYLEALAKHADHANGRNARPTNKTIAEAVGWRVGADGKNRTVTRCRKVLLALDLATLVAEGAQMTAGERASAHANGSKARNWAAVLDLHPSKLLAEQALSPYPKGVTLGENLSVVELDCLVPDSTKDTAYDPVGLSGCASLKPDQGAVKGGRRTRRGGANAPENDLAALGQRKKKRGCAHTFDRGGEEVARQVTSDPKPSRLRTYLCAFHDRTWSNCLKRHAAWGFDGTDLQHITRMHPRALPWREMEKTPAIRVLASRLTPAYAAIARHVREQAERVGSEAVVPRPREVRDRIEDELRLAVATKGEAKKRLQAQWKAEIAWLDVYLKDRAWEEAAEARRERAAAAIRAQDAAQPAEQAPEDVAAANRAAIAAAAVATPPSREDAVAAHRAAVLAQEEPDTPRMRMARARARAALRETRITYHA